jgi:hypothetical protein
MYKEEGVFQMNFDIFKDMDESGLRNYIEFLLRQYRVVDAFWFISIEERYGRETAEEVNEWIWSRVGSLAGKDIRKRFHIEETGLEGFIKTLKFFPWTILGEHLIEQGEDEVILTVPACPPQVARLERGLEEYHCKEMHKNEFMHIAKEVDTRIRIECEFAPPDPHPDELFCKWRFYLS